ncbi:MAG: methyltransferase [Henriciella sp.]|jgi:predicted O-methyltransferase YrrM|uniref:O-methyltransferase n=1 Tax=Henriciella sp. TaxID=1968823 RepID=UPI000C0EE223|nr:O-methyltransferase [Henriciella sp.]MBF35067.1 methyltransferase [Hyphomonadaceae bacterium]MBK76528.1 methyltransferase [Henriciella sp.]PHR78598.1 MAG: methyltransferase [Henriciella sp.]|tara:strand:- start:110 stop:769 length:660 start_codon:yes stop_codon:yes gene_type:complete
MSETQLFEAVDTYINSLFAADDAVLNRAVERARRAGLPEIQVSPGQGKLIYLLAKMIGARRVLEVGTLGGYSTVWLGRALPEDGELLTIELEPDHAAIARETIKDAGLQARCEVIEGKALDEMRALEPSFDLVFLDANKDGYPAYLKQAKRLLRPGGLIVADNVVREGAVLDPSKVDPNAIGAAAFNQALASDADLEAIVLQQVGIKGHDGLAIARVKD